MPATANEVPASTSETDANVCCSSNVRSLAPQVQTQSTARQPSPATSVFLVTVPAWPILALRANATATTSQLSACTTLEPLRIIQNHFLTTLLVLTP